VRTGTATGGGAEAFDADADAEGTSLQRHESTSICYPVTMRLKYPALDPRVHTVKTMRADRNQAMGR